MKTIKLLRLTAALLACFTAGAFAVKWWPKGQSRELKRLGESVAYTAALQRAYRDGDYPRAKQALLTLARHYDSFDAESDTPLNPYASDAKMCYARLAVLEERHGGSGAAAMGEAVKRCERLKTLGSRQWDCSEQYLRREVSRTDALAIYEPKN